MDTQEHARWNALAAEKLEGWRWMRADQSSQRFLLSPGYVAAFNERVPEYWSLAAGDETPGDVSTYPLPPYATDLNAVARLEALVRERGAETQRAYADALVLICAGGPDPVSRFDILTATAAQRLEAVLRCCGLLEGE